MKLFTFAITRRVALIVVVLRDGGARVCSRFTLRGLSMLAAIGGYGVAVHDWSAARQVAVDSLREYVHDGRSDDLERFDDAVAKIALYSRVRQELERGQPFVRRGRDERSSRSGCPPGDVALMGRSARWVRFMPDYETAMVSWAAFDHQIGRLAETAEDLRYRRERNQSLPVDTVVTRIDRHDRLLQQVADDFSASLSDSSHWLHQKIAAAEVAATARAALGRRRARPGAARPRASVGARARRQRPALPARWWRRTRWASGSTVAKGRCCYANPALLRMFGVDRHLEPASLGAVLHRAEPRR